MKERFQTLSEGIDVINEQDIISNLDSLLEINTVNQEDGNNILHYAASNGFLNVFYALKDKDKVLVTNMVNSTNSSGSTPLHFVSANAENSAKIANILLEYGADINIQNKASKATPLHFAVEDEAEGVVKLFIDRGADVNIQDLDKKTPLQYAYEKKNIAIVAALIKKDGIEIDTNTKDLSWERFVDEINKRMLALAEKLKLEEEKLIEASKAPPALSIISSENSLSPRVVDELDSPHSTEKATTRSNAEIYQAFLKAKLAPDKVLDKSSYDECAKIIDKLYFVTIKATPKDVPPLTQVFGDEAQSHIQERINDSGKFSYVPSKQQSDDVGRINEIVIPRLTATGEQSTAEFEVLRLNRDGVLLSYSVEDANGKKIPYKFDKKTSQLDKEWLYSIDKSTRLSHERFVKQLTHQ